MSDSLFMPLAQRMAGRRELTGWEAVWMPLGEGEAERLTAGRGEGWKPVEVPRQLPITCDETFAPIAGVASRTDTSTRPGSPVGG